MNILLVSNYPSDTAYAWWLMEEFWLALSKEGLKKRRKSFLAYPKVGKVSDNIVHSDLNIIEMDFNLSIMSFSKVRGFIKSNNVSIVYFTDRKYFDANYFKLKLSGVKAIIVHDHTPGDRPPVSGFKGLIKSVRNRIPVFTADLFINVSPYMRERSLLNGRIPKHKCKVVQNGIRPLNIRKDRSSVRKELCISEDSIVAVTSGRVHPYKRFDFILDAAIEFYQYKPDSDLVFVFVGDGPQMNELQDRITCHGLHDRVILTGFRKDVHDILNASDFAIHAALGEGFSLSILEYMSASLPVVVPNIQSVSQAIDNLENGFYFEKNSISSLSGIIEKLESDSILRQEMGMKASQKVENEYSFDICMKQFRCVFGGII